MKFPNPFKSEKSEDPRSENFHLLLNSMGITTIKTFWLRTRLKLILLTLKSATVLVRTLFVAEITRLWPANWLSPLINFDHSLDVPCLFIRLRAKGVQANLRRKITEMEAEINSDVCNEGRILNIDTQVKLEDDKPCLNNWPKAQNDLHPFGLYVTIGADNEERIKPYCKQIPVHPRVFINYHQAGIFCHGVGFSKATQPSEAKIFNITRNMDTDVLSLQLFRLLAANFRPTKEFYTGSTSIMIVWWFSTASPEKTPIWWFSPFPVPANHILSNLKALRSLMFDTEVIVMNPVSMPDVKRN